ncbi:MAG TPA: serine hydrolase domain-containing protein [Planctomycetota bacterium]|nr:serine hydrolase domain-containing protein [Planctomycetota bacterium]
MMNRSFAVLLSLFLQFPLILCTWAEPRAQAPQDALAQKIEALAAEQLAKPGGVGLSIAVAQHGKILLAKGYGKADAELDVPANDQTMFRIGSVTKQFTAALVMRLVEQKKLSLSDDLSKYVPEFPLQGRKVTIEQLLQHTSGIKSYTEVTTTWQKMWPLELTHEELLALVKDAPFDFEPGSDWRYCNTGYYLLGMVIEKVAGKSYAEQLQAEICTPLGLTRTRYDSNHELIRNRAQGYAMEGEQLVNDEMFGMSQPGGAGGILSSAGDLVRWQIALSSGKVVKQESFAKMSKPTVLPNGHDTGYGFGLRMEDWEGKPRVWHGGGIFGFNSMLFWLPGDDLHVAVISNGEALASAELADAIAYAALRVERPNVKDEPIPAELITRLSGDYVFAGIRMEARIFEREGKLMLQGSGQEAFRLLWQGGLEFRAEFDNEVRLVFAADGKSLVLHQGGRKADGVRK